MSLNPHDQRLVDSLRTGARRGGTFVHVHAANVLRLITLLEEHGVVEPVPVAPEGTDHPAPANVTAADVRAATEPEPTTPATPAAEPATDETVPAERETTTAETVTESVVDETATRDEGTTADADEATDPPEGLPVGTPSVEQPVTQRPDVSAETSATVPTDEQADA